MKPNPINRLSTVVLIFFLLGMFSVFATASWGNTRIVNISLKKKGNFTKVAVYGNKPFEFTHSTEEAKGGRPYRVVIDCQEAVFDLPLNEYKDGLPQGIITSIRTSQFQVTPERIVRVVLDLKGPVVYKVTDKDSKNEANIAILTTQGPDFPLWVAVLEEEKAPEKVIKAEKPKKETKLQSAAPEDSESKKSGALHSSSAKASSKSVDKDKVDILQTEWTYRRTVCYADTGETIQIPERGLVLLSQMKSEDEAAVKAKSDAAKTESAFTESEAEDTKITEVSTSTESDKDQTQVKVTDKGAKPVSATSSQPSSTQPTFKKIRITQYPGPMGPFPESYYTEKGSTKREMVTATGTKKFSPEELGNLVDKGIGKILGPESVSAKETHALADSEMIIQSSPGVVVDPSSQRRMIHYNPGTRRDPFLPITETGEMSFGDAPLPLFENLRLVGILKDEAGNRALLEDELGFGYIMGRGDKIKNGYLISVENEKAFFHIEEYGGYHIMVLELHNEY
jgi:hypothetical protein